MRQSTSVTSFAALIVVFLQSASAADLPAKAPAPVITPAYNWTGFYIGGNFGGGGNSDRTVSFVPADQAAEGFLFTAGTPGPASFNTIGALGGMQLGYNWQFNRNWLVGFEADFDWSNIEGSASSRGSGFLEPTASFEERVKWFGTVRGRLGFLPVDNFLAYVTGGFAYGRVEHSASYSATALGNGVANAVGTVGVQCFGGATCFAGSSSDIATGWTVGGGFEYAVWRNLTVKAEYLYVNLDSDTLAATALSLPVFFPLATTPASLNANFDTNFHVARVGVNYRF